MYSRPTSLLRTDQHCTLTKDALCVRFPMPHTLNEKSLQPQMQLIYSHETGLLPIPVAERSKAWVCGRSPTGIAGSNTAGDMDVCLL